MNINQKVELYLLGLLRNYENNLLKYTKYYSDKLNKLLIDKYNKTLISSIYYILDISIEFINPEILSFYTKFINKKIRYKNFMEDFWKCDLQEFIKEYNNFIRTKKSYLFYKINLINFVLLLCKLKKYEVIGFKKSDIREYNYKILIESLVKALSCNYNDIYNFYVNFLNYILIIKLKNYHNNKVLNFISNINNNNCFLYLSLNNVKDYTYARTQYTKFCSTIVDPFIIIHETYRNISWKIGHDFITHHIIQRKKEFTRINQINFLIYIKLIYEKFNNYELLNILHAFYHEQYRTYGSLNFTIKDLINQIIKFKKYNLGGVNVSRPHIFIDNLIEVLNIFIELDFFKFIKPSEITNKTNIEFDRIYKQELINSIRNKIQFNAEDIIYKIYEENIILHY